MKKLTKREKETLKYYSNKKKVKKVIHRVAKKRKLTIYGARARNKQLPKKLQRPTRDYDMYANKPRQAAIVIEKKLDKTFGFNAFRVIPAKHKGTYKIKSTLTGETIADLTMYPIKELKVIKRKGLRYAHIEHELENIKRTLRIKKYKFRHKKDRDARTRINIATKLKRRKK